MTTSLSLSDLAQEYHQFDMNGLARVTKNQILTKLQSFLMSSSRSRQKIVKFFDNVKVVACKKDSRRQ